MQRVNSWKIPWCWERLKAGEGDGRGWDGWMASPTQRTWVWVSYGSWWWTGKPGMLQFMGSRSQIQVSNWTMTKNHQVLQEDNRSSDRPEGYSLKIIWSLFLIILWFWKTIREGSWKTQSHTVKNGDGSLTSDPRLIPVLLLDLLMDLNFSDVSPKSPLLCLV